MAVHQQCVPTAVQEEGERVSEKREGTVENFQSLQHLCLRCL